MKNYSIYYVRICFEKAFSKEMEIVAIDEEAAKADIMETYGNTGISYIHVAKLREA